MIARSIILKEVFEMVGTIIHTASLSAVGVGGGMAQIPGSDMPVLMSIQGAMIVAIANCHGHSIDKSGAISMIATFAAGLGGRFVSQVLIGWIPGLGNLVNAGTAGAITEAMGWNANEYFKNLP